MTKCWNCKFKRLAWGSLRCSNPKTGYERWLPVWNAMEKCQETWFEVLSTEKRNAHRGSLQKVPAVEAARMEQ